MRSRIWKFFKEFLRAFHQVEIEASKQPWPTAVRSEWEPFKSPTHSLKQVENEEDADNQTSAYEAFQKITENENQMQKTHD